MNTNISDNQEEEEDKFKNKLIGVVNYGLLEKDASTVIFEPGFKIQDA